MFTKIIGKITLFLKKEYESNVYEYRVSYVEKLKNFFQETCLEEDLAIILRAIEDKKNGVKSNYRFCGVDIGVTYKCPVVNLYLYNEVWLGQTKLLLEDLEYNQISLDQVKRFIKAEIARRKKEVAINNTTSKVLFDFLGSWFLSCNSFLFSFG